MTDILLILILATLIFLAWQSVNIVNTLFAILDEIFKIHLEQEQGCNINTTDNER